VPAGRSIRRYKALTRALYTFTCWSDDRRISFLTLTAPLLRPEYSVRKRSSDVSSIQYFNRVFPRVLRSFLLYLSEEYGVSGFYVLERHKDGRLHAHVVLANAPYLDKMFIVREWSSMWLAYGWRLPVVSVDIQAVIYYSDGRYYSRGSDGLNKSLTSVLSYVVKYVSKGFNLRLRGFGVFSRLTWIYKIFSLRLLGRFFELSSWFVSGDTAVYSVQYLFPKPADVRRVYDKVASDYLRSYAVLTASVSSVSRKVIVRLANWLVDVWYIKDVGGRPRIPTYESVKGLLYYSYGSSPLKALSSLFSDRAFALYVSTFERFMSAKVPSSWPVWRAVVYEAVLRWVSFYGSDVLRYIYDYDYTDKHDKGYNSYFSVSSDELSLRDYIPVSSSRRFMRVFVV